MTMPPGIELPVAGPPPENRCDHCGCRVIDYGAGWEYVESEAESWGPNTCLEGRERDCDDNPGDLYHEVGGRENATGEPT